MLELNSSFVNMLKEKGVKYIWVFLNGDDFILLIGWGW